ncbi:uncharacterized protein [Nicotiana sylvestris]|uniref:uncharacterized protein n=1 Tax=Nicotiana sylvestris TaxID=4096 RepID=UPI00388CBA2A
MKLWDMRNERKEKRGKEMRNQVVLERKLKREMGRGWLVCGTLAIRPYNTRSKSKVLMASKDLDTRIVDPSREIEKSESELNEEVQSIKQQMSEMCQAWANGKVQSLSQLHSYSWIFCCALPKCAIDNQSETTTVMPVFTIPQPTVVQRKTHESQFATQQEQYHSPEYHFYLFDLPAKIEKPGRKIASKEITQRLKSLEQQLKNIQGLAGQKSIAFKDLYMFPDVRLPLGFKTPKFEKYDGHGDLISHLKRYCNQLRGAGGNEELLMFQYNIDISPDHNSFSNLKKKPTENFREYAIKWREQAARVKPPMDDHELITVFLQDQEPNYFQNMVSAVGKSFSKAIKMGEMVENDLKIGKIISQAALKATTQAIQIESSNFSATSEKVEEIMMTSRSRKGEQYRKLSGFEKRNRKNDYPLLAHDDAHFVGRMHGDKEYENPLGNLLTEVNDIEIGEGPSNFDVQPNG